MCEPALPGQAARPHPPPARPIRYCLVCCLCFVFSAPLLTSARSSPRLASPRVARGRAGPGGAGRGRVGPGGAALLHEGQLGIMPYLSELSIVASLFSMQTRPETKQTAALLLWTEQKCSVCRRRCCAVLVDH